MFATSSESAQDDVEPLDSSDEDVYVFPTSFAQDRLWFADQLEPGSALYNIPAAFRLTGPLDATLLERAFNEIVARHDLFDRPAGHHTGAFGDQLLTLGAGR